MVIELRFFKKKNKKKNKMENMKSTFRLLHTFYITTQPILVYTGYFSHILYVDIIKSEINFKLKVKMNKILIYGFQWG